MQYDALLYNAIVSWPGIPVPGGTVSKHCQALICSAFSAPIFNFLKCWHLTRIYNFLSMQPCKRFLPRSDQCDGQLLLKFACSALSCKV